ncbi:MAG: protein kinase [Myxococcales bacterium]|nr:protein kinase [Myxococcales bacterium]
MELLSGTAIGSFVIDVRLASEGTSEIYRAHQPALGRSVRIVRLPDPPDAASNPLPGLDRELRLRARLLHPNVAQLFDCFTQHGAIYLASEDVDGPSLAELLQAAVPIPAAVALQIALELSRGLAEIHERGIVHGDLQPRNLLVSRAGEVKITGFEHAREAGSIDPAEPAGSAHTRPPEQRAGSRRLPASDVFAFARTLQQLLAGRTEPAGSTRFPGTSRRLERSLRASLLEDPALRPRARDLRDALAQELGEPGPLDCRVTIAAWLWEAQSGTAGGSGNSATAEAGRGRTAAARRRALSLVGAAAAILLAGILWVGYERNTAPRDVAAQMLTPADAPGLVSFVAHPWAEIQVDDLPPFVTPQAAPLELAPGEHRVVFRHPTLGSRERTLRVVPGERRRVIEILEPAS